MDRLLQDLRYAARSLRRSPGFALLAILTLALGIGANTAVFSVVNGVVLRPLPYPDAERVVHLGWRWSDEGWSGALTPLKLEYWREHGRVFEGVATHRWTGAALESGDYVDGLRVSEDFLDVVGIPPRLGRGFLPEEDRQGAPDVAMISHGLWRDRYGERPGVIGEEIRIGERSHVIVGVLPEEFWFHGGEDAQVLLPLRLRVDPQDGGHNYSVIARVRPGVSEEAVEADLRRVEAAFRADYPDAVRSEQEGMALLSYHDLYVGGLQRTLWILLGSVGLVLLIACANVANLLLARASGRQRELAVRMALGSGRSRVLRQLVTESLLPAVLAAGLGVLLSVWAVDALLALAPSELPRAESIGLDPRVLAFALALALVTGLGVGLAAALPSARADVLAALKEGGRTATEGRGRGRLRSLLVTGEAALSVVLLSGAGLLIGTFVELRRVDPGFEFDNVSAARSPTAPAGYGDPEVVAEWQRRVLEHLSAVPGIEAAATANSLPLQRGWNIPVTVDGNPEASEGAAEWRAVSPDFFELLGVPLLRGRGFRDGDAAGAAPVAIVNESFARQYWPDADPIGRRVAIGVYEGEPIHPDFGEAAEVVGVVADMREIGLDQGARRTVFVPQAQASANMLSVPHVLVRSPLPPEPVRAAIEEAFRRAEPGMATPRVQPLADIVSASIAQERFNALVMLLFAGSALLLTGIGIYGVVSYTTRQRTHEIGIRMALGARPGSVARMVTKRGMRPVVVGLMLGIVAAFGLTRLLESMIFGVSPTDPLTFLAVAAVLAAVSLAASWLPARRATRVDPVVALKRE